MGEALSQPPDNLLKNDLPCMRCGYNLRTLAMAGRCPECGTEVERSYLATLPENYGWEDLRAGARALAWTPLLNVIFVIPYCMAGALSVPRVEWLQAAVLVLPQVAIHLARSRAIARIALSRPGPPTWSQWICVGLGMLLVLVWPAVILVPFFARGVTAELTTSVLLIPIFLTEGTLTIAAYRFLHKRMRRVQAYHAAVLRPVALIASGCMLLMAAGSVIAFLSTRTGPSILLLAVAGIFLFSRFAHVCYWLLLSEVAGRQIRQI